MGIYAGTRVHRPRVAGPSQYRHRPGRLSKLFLTQQMQRRSQYMLEIAMIAAGPWPLNAIAGEFPQITFRFFVHFLFPPFRITILIARLDLARRGSRAPIADYPGNIL